MLFATFTADDRVTLDMNDAFALGAVCGEDWVGAVAGKENDVAVTVMSHGGNDGIGRIEHRRAAWCDVLDDDAFDDGELVDRGNEIQAKMVTDTDIGNDGDVAHIETQAFTQHAATGRLENGSVDVRVHQYMRALRGPEQSPLSIRRPST